MGNAIMGNAIMGNAIMGNATRTEIAMMDSYDRVGGGVVGGLVGGSVVGGSVVGGSVVGGSVVGGGTVARRGTGAGDGTGNFGTGNFGTDNVGSVSARFGAGWRAAVIVAAALGCAGAWAQAGGQAASSVPDVAAGEKLAGQACAACHGPDGNSAAPVNPKLAAQHPEYLYKQLKEFKAGPDGKPAARPNAVMSAFAAPLSDQDMRNLAAFYAGQQLKPSAARDRDLVGLGRDIYRGGIADKGVPSCAGCHGPTGAGIPSQYPRLAGQFAEYTESQLVGFRSGARANNASMSLIASRLSDREIKAVSDYIAGLR